MRKLLAPIALYPDALLAQMLPASAYPLEIVQAERWLEKNPNLVAAKDFSRIDSQKWDPAVKAMARFSRRPSRGRQDPLDDRLRRRDREPAAGRRRHDPAIAPPKPKNPGALQSNAQQTVRRVGSGPPPSGGAAPQGEGGGGVVAPQGGGNYIAIEPTDPTMLYVLNL